MALLEVENLEIGVEDKTILSDIHFHVEDGESYVMFGPNGSGKTTVINAIMGNPAFKISGGKIIFDGKDITNLDIEKRAAMGISMGFQHPPEITGIKLKDLLKICTGKTPKDDFSEDEMQLIERFKLKEFLDRDVNLGFSGGERKRSEILQMILLKPRLLLLDEPDSGVDIESLKLIGTEIQKYIESSGSSALIVTHQGEIMNHIDVKNACVLLESIMHCFADPEEIFNTIKEQGYKECVRCQRRVVE